MLKPEIFPVIHIDATNPKTQPTKNAGICVKSGIQGIFLIQMEMENKLILPAALRIKEKFPSLKIGINFLGTPPPRVLNIAVENPEISMVWCDQSIATFQGPSPVGISCQLLLRKTPQIELFAGVAFKYQKSSFNPTGCARETLLLGAIPTTSGPGTGQEASERKLLDLRKKLSPEDPLAVASGVSTENAKTMAKYCSHLLVASSIAKDEHNLDPKKLAELQEALPT